MMPPPPPHPGQVAQAAQWRYAAPVDQGAPNPGGVHQGFPNQGLLNQGPVHQAVHRVMPAQAQGAPYQPIAQSVQSAPPAPRSRLDLAPDGAVHPVMPRHDAPLSPINPLQPPPRAQQQVAAPRAGGRSSTGRRRSRAAAVSYKLLAAPVVLVPALWYTVQNPTTVHAALDQLPEPIPRIARAGMEIVLIGSSSTKDGMRLITVADPRNRKGDKLPTR